MTMRQNLNMSVRVALAAVLVTVVSSVLADGNATPVTTGDPTIPTDQLKWLLKPLTQEELVVEATAWRDLLKQKVQEITDAEIGVKQQNEKIEAAAEAAEKVEKAKEAAEEAAESADTEAAEKAREKAEEAAEAVEEAKAAAQEAGDAAPEIASVDADGLEEGNTNALAEAAEAAKAKAESDAAEKKATLDVLTELREERASIIERFNIVLDELGAKGGDIEGFSQYRDAVSEVIVDVSDTSAVFTFVTGWINSEQGGIKWAVNGGKFIGIMVAFWVLSVIVGKITNTATNRSKRMSSLLKEFLNTAVRRICILIGILVGISVMGIPIGPLLAVITAAGFVIGLALQGTLSNFASGLLILAYRPFDVDDAIDAGGVAGVVTAMNLMSTQIMTWDNKQMIVPNNAIWGSVITNITGTDKRRVDMVFGIGYGDSIEKAQAVLERVVKEHPNTLDEPETVIAVHELADSSVNFVVRPWVIPSNYWTVYWDITRQVKDAFDAEGISIPFPQRDVHLIKEE